MASKLKKKPPPHYLQAWLDRKGLTQEQFGNRVGLSASAVSRIASGAKPLMQNRLETFADALGIDIPHLFMEPPAKDRSEDDLTRHLRKIKTAEERARAARILAASFGFDQEGSG